MDAGEAMLKEATAKIRIELPFHEVRERMLHLLAPFAHNGPMPGDAGVQHGILGVTALVGGGGGHGIMVFVFFSLY